MGKHIRVRVRNVGRHLAGKRWTLLARGKKGRTMTPEKRDFIARFVRRF